MTAGLLRAALWYAGRGWRVHPLRPRHKLPLLRGWPDQATTDPDTIRRWCAETPDANVGIATGPASGLLVLDADTADALAGLPGTLPEGPTVRTARGAHCYMMHPDGDAPTTRSHLWPGVDTRGRGGYIVAPPSIHPSGHVYEWTTRPTVPLPTPPDWLLDRLTPPPPPPRREVEFSDPAGASRYAAAALRRECEAVAQAGPGTRNATLNAAAYSLGTLAGAGLIDPVVVAEALSRAALAAGLTAREVERTVASGLRAGAANPREVTHV
ncbi:bifunctional DNA primase/polymerase [Roseospira goensis]|uniref:DNA primase/polymerase bifunctional N-terminal domain-containing protein n=1 Tax=Roseospira goensis TaxID=391922 RepID=A0A7W6S0T9_9PROT|nr:bifunctional DNA primase/polymerase [Roseospira goensis]MBB4286821.1 hypothetical protein [Roseospira goensis]